MRKYFASLDVRMCMENLTWKKFAHIMSFPGTFKAKEEEDIERALKMFMLSGIFSQFNPENEKKNVKAVHI